MERVQEYIAGLDFQHFKWDYKAIDAVVPNFEILGEAVKNIPRVFKGKYPQIPWDEIYRLRNRISHEFHILELTMKFFGTLQCDTYRIITKT
jgi:uncharacterized protein with HEPN domain